MITTVRLFKSMREDRFYSCTPGQSVSYFVVNTSDGTTKYGIKCDICRVDEPSSPVDTNCECPLIVCCEYSSSGVKEIFCGVCFHDKFYGNIHFLSNGWPVCTQCLNLHKFSNVIEQNEYIENKMVYLDSYIGWYCHPKYEDRVERFRK